MALWDIAARVLTQLSATAIGFVIKRFSSGATGDLIQIQDETGGTLTAIRFDGSMLVNGYTDWTMFSGLGRVEWRLFSMGTGSELRIWNQDEGKFHWRAYTDRLEVAAIRPGAINPYNSLTALKIAGLGTASGKPTSGTWVAGDTFMDSKGTDQLCTVGGTPGTWVSGGWQLAGFYKFASALATSGAVTVAAFDELMIVMRVVSISSTGDIPVLQFNGDTGTNYRWRYVINTTTTTTATISAVQSPTSSAAASSAQMSGQSSAGQRIITAYINNRLGTSKLGTVNNSIGSGVGLTQTVQDLAGTIEWINTAAQITSVTMKTLGGSFTFAIDSGFQVFGRDFA